MTQDMGNKISHHNQAVAREQADLRQALGRLMSMVRSRQGASKELARVWLGGQHIVEPIDARYIKKLTVR